jgi:Ca-activated chloride channel family protein
MGNLKDSKMEALADKGNGNYAYIDSLQEARKVLVEEAGGTLVTIAKDVKIQVEFNPAKVAAYRLIGYENRVLAAQDFNDDAKDAGEIGAGHSVTALYEVVPVGQPLSLASVDALKYQQPRQASTEASGAELMTVKLRYKDPEGATSKLLSVVVNDAGSGATSPRVAFASAVAGFGMLLRESEHKGSLSYAGVKELAQQGLGPDRSGYRAEFLHLVARAESLAEGQRFSRN